MSEVCQLFLWFCSFLENCLSLVTVELVSTEVSSDLNKKLNFVSKENFIQFQSGFCTVGLACRCF